MNELSSTTHGRILSAGIAIVLLGGGAAAVMQGGAAQALMSVTVMVGAAVSIVGVAQSVGEHKTPLYTTLALICLPVLLFLYAIGMGLAMKGAPWAGYCFLGLGAVFAGFAALGGRRTEAASKSEGARGTGETAGAH